MVKTTTMSTKQLHTTSESNNVVSANTNLNMAKRFKLENDFLNSQTPNNNNNNSNLLANNFSHMFTAALAQFQFQQQQSNNNNNSENQLSTYLNKFSSLFQTPQQSTLSQHSKTPILGDDDDEKELEMNEKNCLINKSLQDDLKTRLFILNSSLSSSTTPTSASINEDTCDSNNNLQIKLLIDKLQQQLLELNKKQIDLNNQKFRIMNCRKQFFQKKKMISKQQEKEDEEEEEAHVNLNEEEEEENENENEHECLNDYSKNQTQTQFDLMQLEQQHQNSNINNDHEIATINYHQQQQQQHTGVFRQK